MHIYAYIDENNKVVEIIEGKNTPSNFDWESYYSNKKCCLCKRGSSDGSYRKNRPAIGYDWDAGRDAFIPPKPYDSWTLNESTCQWDAPTARPEGFYDWNESTQTWDVKPE